MKNLHKIIFMAIISAVLIMMTANVAYNYGYNKAKDTQEVVYETIQDNIYVQDTINVENKVMKLLITYAEYVNAAESIIGMYYEHDSEYYLDIISETDEYIDYINVCDRLNKYNYLFSCL